MRLKQAVWKLTIVMALTEVLLVFTSWLLSAMMIPGVRPILSTEGIRWFFGNFTTMMATPVLVSLMLVAMALGSLWRSGLWQRPQTYRDRTARRTVLILLVVYVAVVLSLSVIPHAVLLSATGRLLPSPFSRALLPVMAFGLLLLSSVYGLLSGRLTSLSSVCSSMSYDIETCSPLFVLYVFSVQLYESIRFVFL